MKKAIVVLENETTGAEVSVAVPLEEVLGAKDYAEATRRAWAFLARVGRAAEVRQRLEGEENDAV